MGRQPRRHPPAARDDANRTLLGTEIDRIDRELADTEARWQAALAEPLPPGMEGQGETRRQRELREQVERLREQRAGLRAVQDTIAPDGRHLLLLDLARDRPRAVVAVGDVDTADHVAVFTPGMESDVAGDLGRYTDDMRQVRQTALNELRNVGRGDETVAAVTWLGAAGTRPPPPTSSSAPISTSAPRSTPPCRSPPAATSARPTAAPPERPRRPSRPEGWGTSHLIDIPSTAADSGGR